ncbi:MAG: hypothetical protein U5L95_03080 [Candidatus Saccharibacteria bacterium]|nr:hypothetical protein [Candidatus Saccharibacteria bacterium]
MNDTPKNKKHFKKFSGLAVALIVVAVLLAGSAAAYFGYIVPNRPKLRFPKTPEPLTRSWVRCTRHRLPV